MVRIIVADAPGMPEVYKEKFERLGDLKIYLGHPSSIKEFLCRIEGADIAVVSHHKLPAEVFESKALRFIALTRTGYDDVDVEAASRKGIPVANAPGYSNEAVAEHVFAMMLSFSRRIIEADYWMREGQFNCTAFEGRELRGKTIGVIGTGRIGSRVSEIAACFGMHVIAYDTGRPNPNFRYVTMDQLCSASDYITIHLPLTSETKNLIGESAFRLMRPNAVLINTARGGIVDQGALIRALEERRIGGACMDVFEQEPLPEDSQLLALSNTLLTPHIAYNTREAKVQSITMAAENVASFLQGKSKNIVNPGALTLKH